MRAISLFSGIGGIDLAAEWAGIEVVLFVERDPFCQKVLNKHWPHVPIIDDIRKVTKELLLRMGVIGNGRTIDLIFGGYPCQGESGIGKRKGQEDERWLWPEMFRLIRELRPTWVLGENVDGHLTMGYNEVITNLEIEDYGTRTFVLPAVSVGAPHERYRVFIVGNASSQSKSQTDTSVGPVGGKRDTRKDSAWITRGTLSPSYWQIHQPPVPGVDDGIPDRVERSRAAGNAVVPQHVFPILQAIKLIHDQAA
ncbi:DNA cytosine methyltransferase [Brevibacillus formosus]|uniref:DNA cytosine methyltransferase n=1 Tax=Brevibacillus formosus TaxID=54913 RepID=UPI0018CCA17E|nr:DNA cytosine methyltransferase [Brevibacillus formosus]MBG9944661.1 DNA methylase [Brevibacillus formosus]